jgi:hypothetical protein
MKEILRRQNLIIIIRQVYPALLLDVSAGNSQRVVVDESGMIRSQMGDAQWIRKWSQCNVALCAHPITVTMILS